MRILIVLITIVQVTSLGKITKDELLGKFNPADHEDFLRVEAKYTNKQSIYLRKEAYKAFTAMHDAASDEDIELKIISATRNFNYQKSIWERKWDKPKYMGWEPILKAKDILTYSSMPGTSRHHWGTDIDMNNLNNSYFESGQGLKIYAWLQECASEYGFKQVYTSKEDGRTGYNEEKWHWSYTPLSDEYLKEYNRLVSIGDIEGFIGSTSAEGLNVINEYVNGID